MRAIVLSNLAEAAAVDSALGYPRPGLRTDHTIAPGAGVTTRHAEPSKDTLARDVYEVAGVESALPAPLRARVVNVTRTVVVDAIATEKAVP